MSKMCRCVYRRHKNKIASKRYIAIACNTTSQLILQLTDIA